MSSPLLLGVAAMCVVFLAVAIYYITALKNGFGGLRRLERPWVALECGAAALIVGALTVPWVDTSTSIGILHLVQIAAVVVAAFFILAAMVMMKQAWTIGEGD
jgi:hypothetical protein